MTTRTERLVLFLVLAVTLGVYGLSLSGAYCWDDTGLIYENAAVRGQGVWHVVSTPFWGRMLVEGQPIAPLYQIIHRPLVKLLFAYVPRLGEFAPVVFHLISLALHLGTVALVHRLVLRLLGFAPASFLPDADGRGDADPPPMPADRAVAGFVALSAAALLALHPAKVEAVAWISGITDLAMTFFTLAALDVLASRPGVVGLGLGALCVALAGFSKETAVLTPGLVVLEGLATGTPRRELARRVAATAVGCAVFVGAWFGAVDFTDGGDASKLRVPRAVVMAWTYGSFLARTVFPFPPTLYPEPMSLDDRGQVRVDHALVVAGAALGLATLGSLVRDLRRRAFSRTSFGLVWFCLTLAPVSNFVLRKPSSLTADRFLCLSLVGVAVLLADPLRRAFERAPRLAGAVVAALVLVGGVSTRASTERWQDDLALFRHEARLHPALAEPLKSYAGVLAARGRTEEALAVTRAAMQRLVGTHQKASETEIALLYLHLRLNAAADADERVLMGIRRAYDGYAEGGDLVIDDGSIRYRNPAVPALRRDIVESDDFQVHRAVAHARTGDAAGAERIARAILRGAPTHAKALEVLAVQRARQGDLGEARRVITEARAAYPAVEAFTQLERIFAHIEETSRHPLTDPTMLSLRAANFDAMLGSPGAARRRLAPILALPSPPLEAWFIATAVELSDRQFLVARQHVERGLVRAPGHPALLRLREQVEAQIARSEAAAAESARDAAAE